MAATWDVESSVVRPRPRRIQLSSSLASIQGRRRAVPRSYTPSSSGLTSASQLGGRSLPPLGPSASRTSSARIFAGPTTLSSYSARGHVGVRPFFAGPQARISFEQQSARPTLNLEELRVLAGIPLPAINGRVASPGQERERRLTTGSSRRSEDAGGKEGFDDEGGAHEPSRRRSSALLGGGSRRASLMHRTAQPPTAQGWALTRLALRTGKLRASSGILSRAGAPLTAAELAVDVAWHVRRCPLFATCSGRQLAAIAASARVISAPRYQVLYREGTSADGGPLIIVAAGSVRLRGFDDRQAIVLPAGSSAEASRSGSCLGLEAAASDAAEADRRRADTATVGESALLILLSPTDLPPAVREQATARANGRLLQAGGPSRSVFADLPPSQQRAVARLFTYRVAPAGCYLTKQGEFTDSFFELVLGELQVVVEGMIPGSAAAAAANRHAPGAGGRLPSRAAAEPGARSAPPADGGDEPSDRPPRPRKLSAAAADAAAARQLSGDVVVDIVTSSSDYRHFGEGGFMSWLSSGGKLGLNRRSASVIALQPSWVLELPPQHFAALRELVPGIAQRFKTAHEIQQRSHALRLEQIGEDGVRRMLAEHKAHEADRALALASSRQYRERLERTSSGLGSAPLSNVGVIAAYGSS